MYVLLITCSNKNLSKLGYNSFAVLFQDENCTILSKNLAKRGYNTGFSFQMDESWGGDDV